MAARSKHRDEICKAEYRWWEVTVVERGRRYTIKVQAQSVYYAALHFFARCCEPELEGELPRTTGDTVFEVKSTGNEKPDLISQKELLKWANREWISQQAGRRAREHPESDE
jgi:hypothetical protein